LHVGNKYDDDDDEEEMHWRLLSIADQLEELTALPKIHDPSFLKEMLHSME